MLLIYLIWKLCVRDINAFCKSNNACWDKPLYCHKPFSLKNTFSPPFWLKIKLIKTMHVNEGIN